jgi:ssDNA-binding Zn-finger/Zn-ribbon topoisomerase 1
MRRGSAEDCYQSRNNSSNPVLNKKYLKNLLTGFTNMVYTMGMIKLKELKQITCIRCGHAWIPRKLEIRTCPKCNSPYFDKPKQAKTGGQLENPEALNNNPT